MKQIFLALIAGTMCTTVFFGFNSCQGGKNKNAESATSGNINAKVDTIHKTGKYSVIQNPDFHEVSAAASPIKVEDALRMIRIYDDKTKQQGPSFIDFDFDEIYDYLAELRKTGSTTNCGVRLYFGIHTAETAKDPKQVGELSLILVATRNKVDLINQKPIDYGNLCPPGTNCTDTSKADQLIYKARRLK